MGNTLQQDNTDKSVDNKCVENESVEHKPVEDESVVNDHDKKIHPKKEEIKISPSEPTKLDVAFVLDCTGSMNQYIESCKNNIIQISNRIHNECENCDVQFGLILYRDIPPQDTTFITKILNFTPIPLQIRLELSQMNASGGGDTPEALTSALYDCYKNLNWRGKSIKIIIVITDAPPHGLETDINDGFPNGDLDTFNQHDEKEGDTKSEAQEEKYLNVIEIIKQIRDDLRASIYSIACEPSISCYRDFANDFMQYMAEYTQGKFLPLWSADLLPDVIIGSVKQQINLDELSNKLENDIQKIKAEYGENITNEKLNKLILEKWQQEEVKKTDINITSLYPEKRPRDNINLLMNEQLVKSLADFKQKCKKFPRMKESDFRRVEHTKMEEKKDSVTTEENVNGKSKKIENSGGITGIISSFASLFSRNKTGRMLGSVEADLDEAVREQEMGFGAAIGRDAVGFNPLASGFNPNAPAGGPKHPPCNSGGGGDFIRPNVEKPVFKQSYGQSYNVVSHGDVRVVMNKAGYY